VEVELDSVSAPFVARMKRGIVVVALVLGLAWIAFLVAFVWGVLRLSSDLQRAVTAVRGAAWDRAYQDAKTEDR